jgi:hypothetical protein
MNSLVLLSILKVFYEIESFSQIKLKWALSRGGTFKYLTTRYLGLLDIRSKLSKGNTAIEGLSGKE